MPEFCHRPAPAVETTGAGALSCLAAEPCAWFGQLLLRTTVTASETTAEEFWFLCLQSTRKLKEGPPLHVKRCPSASSIDSCSCVWGADLKHAVTAV